MNETTPAPKALTIIGAGRLGRSIAASHSPDAGESLQADLLGRDFANHDLAGSTLLLCVPDREIGAVATSLKGSGNLPESIGHTSGATTLEPLAGCHTGGGTFSLHPLQTIPDGHADLTGCPAAVAGSDGPALELAFGLAEALGMNPFRVAETDRALYHAAASIASNFLITLEETAAGILGGIRIENPRQVLAPLVRQTLENWTLQGSAALTGPIVRGDVETVESHRSALAGSHPDLLDFYDNLAGRTRAVAGITPDAEAAP